MSIVLGKRESNTWSDYSSTVSLYVYVNIMVNEEVRS